MVDAQQARRVLDRLVGYKISPLLWDKVRRGLSAGRVQSVALKLICDREREIEAFVPEEYWNIIARLAGPVPPEFDAKLLKKGGDDHQGRQRGRSRRRCSPTSKRADVDRRRRSRRRSARSTRSPPFITSKLQQAARFPVKKTMMIAQQLYEGIELPGEEARSASSPTCEPTRRACRTRRSTDGARVHRRRVRRRLRAGEAERLQGEGGRAGRARSDPPDVDAVRPGDGAGAPDAGSVLPLPADLEPLRRVADAAGDVRRDDRRHQRRATTCSASRARCRSSPAGWRSTTRRPVEAAHRGPGPRRGRARKTTTARACCRRCAKAIGSS